MDVGIVGRPGSGRSTVFRALLAHRAPREAGARSAPHVGTITVAEPRLGELARRFRPRRVTPVELRIHDCCPSLEPGFPRAELEALRRLEPLLLVVPAFADPSPAAAVAAFDALLDELCFEDLAAVDRRLRSAPRERLDERVRRALEVAAAALEAGRPLGAWLAPEARAALAGSALLTDRSLLALANVAEEQAGEPPPEALARRVEERRLPLLALAARLEAEMATLPPEERGAFLAEYGVSEPAGAAVTRAILAQADLISFFTVGEDECRAWAVRRGTPARSAAGKIHTDLERGFIRAEVIGYQELVGLEGGLAEARRLGKLRLEGKDYVVRDGDVVHVRFNV